jgi:hypothetical protein
VPRSGSRACLGVRAGSLPTASRSGPLVPFTPAALGTRAASSYRAILVCSEVPNGPTPVPAHTSRGWPPYCEVNAGSLLRGEEKEPPCYKGCSRSFLGHACRRPPLEVAWRAPPSEPHRDLYNLPWPPYCTPRAPQVTCVPGRASCSPEDRPQRPPEAGAAEPPRWHALGVVQPSESVVGEPLSTPPPFPGRAEPPLARIELPPPAMALGTQLQSKFSSRGPVCEIRGSVRKSVSPRFAESCKIRRKS